MELSSKFNFKEIEGKWCSYWEKNNIFHAQVNAGKKSYTVVIPPPNVTGILHMGHALNNTLQDIIVRYQRMNGFETCWMPGTDHAGIATQNVVEKQLAKEDKSRHDIGREEMVRRLWDWKKQYGDTIINQLKNLGASCDWPRTRFTMDDEYSEAVKHVFVRLYEKGLIYRGQYIINWCPRCQTALSDEEAEHKEVQGNLYHIRYPFKDNPQQYIVVATTRPETMLGDTAVAVNPQDERYKKVIGKTLVLPLLKREIKVISDEFVDSAFGTGAVKVTPAHDPNDFAMGKRHNLEFINIMHPDATLNENAGPYAGLDRFKARAKVVENLKDANFFDKVEQHTHSVGHCYRCSTVIEPYLSKQWFVKMAPLAQPALKAVEEGRIKFYPQRWTKVYTNWMEGIRDWCISRQIWWGHRIPVWYCDNLARPETKDSRLKTKTENQDSEKQRGTHCPPIVSMTTPQQCPACGSKKLRQDEDVLDTWFSSWLWPFATFGWPADTAKKELAYFYPGAALFTASEIIFFWVARMIMAGMEFMKEIPFSDVYIHGTVRDEKGRKMSKSLGNAIDPLEIISEYGADALRFSLIINSGQDLFIAKDKFEIGRNFANKIWNATRLILLNGTPEKRSIDPAKDLNWKKLDLPSRWIVARFYTTLQEVNQAVDSYRFSEAENLIYEFFWGNFCDWYLEITKNNAADPDVQKIRFFILEQSIRLIHPFMPFVTEEIWQHLQINEKCLAVQAWPKMNPALTDEPAEKQMQLLIDIVSQVRNVRAQWNIKPQLDINCSLAIQDSTTHKLLQDHISLLKHLLRIQELSLSKELPVIPNAATGVVGPVKFSIPLGTLVDIEKEKQRILKQIAQQQKAHDSIAARLQNENFVSKAPAEIIEKERARMAVLQKEITDLESVIKNLN